MVVLIVELAFSFQLPYEDMTPFQAAGAIVQKVSEFNTQVIVLCHKKITVAHLAVIILL